MTSGRLTFRLTLGGQDPSTWQGHIGDLALHLRGLLRHPGEAVKVQLVMDNNTWIFVRRILHDDVIGGNAEMLLIDGVTQALEHVAAAGRCPA